MASSKVFAYIDKGYKLSTALKTTYRNSLIFIGDEGQIYSPVNDTYIGIGHTAYTNTISYIENAYAYVIDQVGAALNAIISNSVQHNVNQVNGLEKEVTIYSTTYNNDVDATHVGTHGTDIVIAAGERADDYKANYGNITTNLTEGSSEQFVNGIGFTSYTLWVNTLTDAGQTLTGLSTYTIPSWATTRADKLKAASYANVTLVQYKDSGVLTNTTVDDSKLLLETSTDLTFYTTGNGQYPQAIYYGHHNSSLNVPEGTYYAGTGETYYVTSTASEYVRTIDSTGVTPGTDIIVRVPSEYYQDAASKLTLNYKFLGSYVYVDDTKTVDYVKKSLAYSMTFTKFWADNRSNEMYTALLGMEYIPVKLDNLDGVNQLDDSTTYYVYQKSVLAADTSTAKNQAYQGGQYVKLSSTDLTVTDGVLTAGKTDEATTAHAAGTDVVTNKADYAQYADGGVIVYTHNDAASSLTSNTNIADGIQTIKEVAYVLDVITNGGDDAGISLAYTIAGNHTEISKLTDEVNELWNGGDPKDANYKNVNSLSYTNSQYIWLEVTGDGNSTHYVKLTGNAQLKEDLTEKHTEDDENKGKVVLYYYDTVAGKFMQTGTYADTTLDDDAISLLKLPDSATDADGFIYIHTQATTSYTGNVNITPHLNILSTSDIKENTTASESGVGATASSVQLNGRDASVAVTLTYLEPANAYGGLVDDTLLNTYVANSYALTYNTIKAVQINSMTYTVETLNNYNYDSRYAYYRNVSGESDAADGTKTTTAGVNGGTSIVWTDVNTAGGTTYNDPTGASAVTTGKYIKLVEQTNGYVTARYGVFQTSTHHFSQTATATTLQGIDRNGSATNDGTDTTYNTGLDGSKGSTYNYAQLHVEGDVINLSTYTYAVESVTSYGFLADALAVKSYIMDVLSWVDITPSGMTDTKLEAAWRAFGGATTTNFTYASVTGIGDTFLYKGTNTATNANEYATEKLADDATNITAAPKVYTYSVVRTNTGSETEPIYKYTYVTGSSAGKIVSDPIA